MILHQLILIFAYLLLTILYQFILIFAYLPLTIIP